MVTGLPSLDALQQAFGYVESSNRYDAIGPRTRRGNNAYGRYQVMDFNVPSWTEQYFGQRLTPQQFLGNPQAQDAVFYGRMGEYYNRGQGTPEDRVRNAASLWFTGQPYSAETAGRSDGFINNQEYGDRILRALGSAPQGASTMSMNPDPQPQGLFGGIGQGLRNMFGGGQPDPNAGSPTDPFEGLSRAQRTMLGFAALRDAAAALEGRDSSFFNEALGGFEAARERERLRVQGDFANRNQQMLALAQLQALGRATNDPSLTNYATSMLEQLMGGAAAVPGMVAPAAGAGGATPMPVDFTGGTLPADMPTGPQGVTGPPVTGQAFDPGSATPVPYDGAPETPLVSEPVAAPADPIAAIDMQLADIEAQINDIISAAPDAGQSAAASLAGVSIADPQAQLRLDRLQEEEARLLEQRGVLAQAAADAAADAAAAQARTETRTPQTVNTLQTVQDLRSAIQENPRLTTGFWGSILGNVPASEAYDARALSQTIRANLGFDQLQAMREASPTGGALGQVAVQELEALQSTIANLDLNQSADQVMRNLEAIENNYQRLIRRAYETTQDIEALDRALGGRPAFMVEGGGENEGWQDLGNGVRIRVRN